MVRSHLSANGAGRDAIAKVRKDISRAATQVRANLKKAVSQ